MAGLVRTWVKDERAQQHLAQAPDSDTAREWDGTTLCGLQARLVWVPYERVDVREQCEVCTARFDSPHPPTEGDHPGPA